MGSSTSRDAGADSCPVPAAAREGIQYNVYNQRIDGQGPASACPAVPVGVDLVDPKNNMPLAANQQPAPGQVKPLPTDREQSTIPKGGTNSTWTYPSPQMFFNALRRKGKGDDVTEDDMVSVVLAHNSMNERTWQAVLHWEQLHQECNSPTLMRFCGRPDDLSPKARLRSWLTGELPFDRHDWYLDRCGKEVRYVIDFYFHEDQAGSAEAFSVDARPAVDSMEAALDRVKMTIYKKFAEYGLPCPVTGQAGHVGATSSSATGGTSSTSTAAS
mmetsp:Transcript_464/g.1412  ORF Transcript_464/g.1412 Transcript_464/m.1412 type:complete len:272 (-) Transcript_464:1459-2274(-)